MASITDSWCSVIRCILRISPSCRRAFSFLPRFIPDFRGISGVFRLPLPSSRRKTAFRTLSILRAFLRSTRAIRSYYRECASTIRLRLPANNVPYRRGLLPSSKCRSTGLSIPKRSKVGIRCVPVRTVRRKGMKRTLRRAIRRPFGRLLWIEIRSSVGESCCMAKMASIAKYAKIVSIVSFRLVAPLSDYVVEVVRLRFAYRSSAVFASVRAFVPDTGEEFLFGSVRLYPLFRPLSDRGYGLRRFLRSRRDPEGKRGLPAFFYRLALFWKFHFRG